MNRSFSILLALFCMALNSKAQNLPGKQKSGIRIPTTLKIDGRADEFNGQFLAYNHAVNLYYTIANDDKYLYLIAKATDSRIIHKILYVGIGLTIIDKNNKKDNISVTYPNITFNEANNILGFTGLKAVYQKIGQRDTTKKSTDSLRNLANNALLASSKTIKITNLKGITDSVISAYNNEEIKVSQHFDDKVNYIYEMLIPLKYLNLSIDKTNAFNYKITLISRIDANKGKVPMVYNYPNGIQTDMNADLDSTTDFQAEYILAKK